jgi:hypothetical protein
VQIEAARTYQDWGSFQDSHENYLRAILGARPDKTKNNKNTIWGWGEIARMTAPSSAGGDKYKDQFHEARYNLALCRYNYAVKQKDAAKKKENFQRAKTDIAIIAGFYPDLGGEKWKAQYDTLLKKVQGALGERPLGLPALQSAQPAAAGNAAAGKAGGSGGSAKTVPTSTPAPAAPKAKAAPAKAATTKK